jgi:SAM-dependent methyltransferase
MSATEPASEPVTDAPTVSVELCPLCGSPIYQTAFSEPPYEVRRCGACGLGYVTPRRAPEALQAMYGDDSYWRSRSPKTHGYNDYRSDQELYLKSFRMRLDHALRATAAGTGVPGRALDVGCAAGFCMAALRERGFRVNGVEVSATIASHAINELGFGDAVFIGTLHDAPYEPGSFDLITMWDVVEHVPEALALLQRAKTLLKPGGTLIVETQDIDSPFARVLGRRWHHFKHAEHIYHFTPATIRRLLSDAGFEVQRLSHRYGGKYVSTGFIAERAGRLHPLVSKALEPLARRSAGKNLYLNFLDEMVVVARG